MNQLQFLIGVSNVKEQIAAVIRNASDRFVCTKTFQSKWSKEWYEAGEEYTKQEIEERGSIAEIEWCNFRHIEK